MKVQFIVLFSYKTTTQKAYKSRLKKQTQKANYYENYFENMAFCDMKMFAEMKTCIIKELMLKLKKDDIMSDELEKFFKNEIYEIKSIKLTVNKINKKEKKVSNTKKTNDKPVKQKRAPTEHQTRVSECMVFLKKHYSQVKHTIRLGTANYMATFLKQNNCAVVDVNEPVFEKAHIFAITKMNKKEDKEIYIIPTTSNENIQDEKKEDEKKEDEKKEDEKKEESDEEESDEEESDEEESDEEEEEEEDMTDLVEESDDDE